MACVLSSCKNMLDTLPNLLIVSIDFSNDFFPPISCGSSANWDILCSFSFIQIPLILLSSRIVIAKISIHKTNMYDNIWSPCRHPHSAVNHWVICSIHYYHWLYIFFYKKVFFHLQRSFPKPNGLRALNMNLQLRDSNAFSKSRHNNNPGLFSIFKQFIKS